MADDTKPPEDDGKIVDLSKRRTDKTKGKKAAAPADDKPAKKPNPMEVKPTIEVPKIDLRAPLGRPPALVPDAPTLAKIRQFAALQLTQNEAAAAMLVARSTFKKFLAENEAAREAWDMGGDLGNASVKRVQFVQAHKSVTAAIWYGKQHLGQADKIEQKADPAAQAEINTANAELERLRRLVGIDISPVAALLN